MVTDNEVPNVFLFGAQFAFVGITCMNLPYTWENNNAVLPGILWSPQEKPKVTGVVSSIGQCRTSGFVFENRQRTKTMMLSTDLLAQHPWEPCLVDPYS